MLVSGVVIMIVDTTDLLFFLGLALTLTGLYVLFERSRFHRSRRSGRG